jgi:hypothetical protein
MNDQTDFTVKAESEDFKNTLFLAMELSRATWLVATFAVSRTAKWLAEILRHAAPGKRSDMGKGQSVFRRVGAGRLRFADLIAK